MNRNLFLLTGLAIFGVVISHAASWGQTAMYSWFDYIRQTVDPTYHPIGGIAYYVLLSARLIFSFSVAAFLYVSARFLVYTVGKQQTVNRKLLTTRIYALLVPYLFWSLLIFVYEFAINHTVFSFSGYVYRLLLLGADGPYYYVPLLCYLYLLSPFLILFARKHWKLLLVVTGSIQLASMAVYYLAFFVPESTASILWKINPDQSVLHWIFYFTFGLVTGIYADQFIKWSYRKYRIAFFSSIVLVILAILEYDITLRIRGTESGNAPITLFTTLYSLTFIVWFQSINVKQFPFSNIFYKLGIQSYGLYLTHMKSMEFIARFIYHFLPAILLYQIIFQPILWVFGFGVTLLFMYMVKNTPTRRYYRFLFG